jgi:carbon monoxide dehydrogenase subunit G
MHYQAGLQIGGKIAAVGLRLLDTVSRMMLRQGLEAMTRELERRLAAGEGGGAA